MESLGVLLALPVSPYLESKLHKRFTLFRLWRSTDRRAFLRQHSSSIRAVGNADTDMISVLPRPEIVSSYSASIDEIDLGMCRERGIRATSVLTDDNDIADLAMGLAIGVMRRIGRADRHVRSGSWKARKKHKLTSRFSGTTVGIVGLDRINSAIAKRAEAFGCPICYYSRSANPNTNHKYYTNILDLATDCRVLMLACSLTEEIRPIISREVIDALGPKGVLVSVGRGSCVDEPELVSALLEGRLGGAGLVVYNKKPEVPEELFGLDNVVLLPHVGGNTSLVLGNLEADVLNLPLLTPVL